MRIKCYWFFVLLGFINLFLCACSQEDLSKGIASESLKRIEVELNATRPDFDTHASRSHAQEWKDGDCVFLEFLSQKSSSYGIATYNSISQKWIMQYSGDIRQTQDGDVRAYFIDIPNASESSSFVFKIDGKYPVYWDNGGMYTYNGTTLTVATSLSSANSRIRFQGNPGDTLYVNGLNLVYSFNLKSDFKFQDYENNYNLPLIISDSVSDDGKYYTDYVYLAVTDSCKKNNDYVSVMTYKDAYTHKLPNDLQVNGVSGFMTIPQEINQYNWVKENPLLNISFPDSISTGRKDFILEELNKMIKVDGGVLYNNTHAYMYPFYVMKTEVSNALYYAVMNEIPDYKNLDKDAEKPLLYPFDAGTTQLPPKAGEYENMADVPIDIFRFLYRLNEITGLYFDIPYEMEWEYVARGGRKTQNYSKIGNVTPENYDWDSIEEYKSGKHFVESGPSNELGVLGLCSNVSEICYYAGSSYSNLSTFDFTPIYPQSGTDMYFIWRGASATDLNTSRWTVWAYHGDGFNSVYRDGHFIAPDDDTSWSDIKNMSRGIRLVLRFQDNLSCKLNRNNNKGTNL